MTNDQILQIAARHSAYADCTPTLRGDAILAFAREVLDENDRVWLTMIEEHRQSSAWYAKHGHKADCD